MLLIFLISYQAHSPSDAQCHRCLGPFSLLTKLNCVSFDLMPFTKMPFIPLHSYARDTVANKSISMNEFWDTDIKSICMNVRGVIHKRHSRE